MFWFLLIALVAVVGAVTLVVIGGGDGGALPEAQPDRVVDPLPEDRPVDRADIEDLRLPLALRGYRMMEVDDALGRLGAELAERDARIAELEAALAGTQATAYAGPGLIGEPGATPTARAVPPVAPADAMPVGPSSDAAPGRAGHGGGPAGAHRPSDAEESRDNDAMRRSASGTPGGVGSDESAEPDEGPAGSAGPAGPADSDGGPNEDGARHHGHGAGNQGRADEEGEQR